MIPRKIKGSNIKSQLRQVNKNPSGKETPLQDRIYHIIKENPDIAISELYPLLSDIDFAHVRRAIRKMVEGHKIKQKFTII